MGDGDPRRQLRGGGGLRDRDRGGAAARRSRYPRARALGRRGARTARGAALEGARAPGGVRGAGGARRRPSAPTPADAAAAAGRAAGHLRSVGATTIGAGLHPDGAFGDVVHYPSERYRLIGAEMRGLMTRTPTAALHVHVGMPDSETAIRAYNGLRAHLPLLQALAANSPFWHGRDSGLASARAQVFRALPRSEIPAAFASFDEYVASVEALAAAGDLPDYTFLWWDIRLHPVLGTVEVRSMDSQSSLADVAGLAALVHALARRAVEEHGPWEHRDVLMESSFRAARDGLDATLWHDRRAATRPGDRAGDDPAGAALRPRARLRRRARGDRADARRRQRRRPPARRLRARRPGRLLTELAEETAQAEQPAGRARHSRRGPGLADVQALRHERRDARGPGDLLAARRADEPDAAEREPAGRRRARDLPLRRLAPGLPQAGRGESQRDVHRRRPRSALRTFLSHIRHATVAEPNIENTHPFEQQGRLLAHNGVVGDLEELRPATRQTT